MARGWLPMLPSSAEITKICDNANAIRNRNWSGPVAACFQNDSHTWSCPALAVGVTSLIAASAASQ